jgi:glycosyltransferase involved in cell wall biosynthesis
MKKKVLLVGPILTQSGYGEHARMVYRALKSREDLFDIFINPVNWGATSWVSENTEERKEIDELINKTFDHMQKRLPFDTTIMVTIPSEWKQYRAAPENIGVCAGIESDKMSPQWIQSTNAYVDKVVVPSEFAKEIYNNSTWDIPTQATPDGQPGMVRLKAEKPVIVVNYPVEDEFVSPSTVLHDQLKFEHDFNFLCVAQWGPRKNIINTIKSFLDEFGDDEVGLVLKVSMKDGSTIDFYETKKKIKNILAKHPDRKCSVHLVHGYMTKEELSSLYTHPQIKAMINFGHGEGYGLPLFEAAAVGLPVITHDWGGQKDFLYAPKKNKKGTEKLRPHFSKVSFELKPIQEEAVWDGVLDKGSQWAFPHLGSCRIAMRQCYENYGLCSGQAKRLQEWVLDNFSQNKINSTMVDTILGINQDELDDWLSSLGEMVEL